jgi:hypothetical protein
MSSGLGTNTSFRKQSINLMNIHRLFVDYVGAQKYKTLKCYIC